MLETLHHIQFIAGALFYTYLDLKEEFMNFKPRMAVYLVCNCESLYMQVWVRVR